MDRHGPFSVDDKTDISFPRPEEAFDLSLDTESLTKPTRSDIDHACLFQTVLATESQIQLSVKYPVERFDLLAFRASDPSERPACTQIVDPDRLRLIVIDRDKTIVFSYEHLPELEFVTVGTFRPSKGEEAFSGLEVRHFHVPVQVPHHGQLAVPR